MKTITPSTYKVGRSWIKIWFHFKQLKTELLREMHIVQHHQGIAHVAIMQRCHKTCCWWFHLFPSLSCTYAFSGTSNVNRQYHNLRFVGTQFAIKFLYSSSISFSCNLEHVRVIVLSSIICFVCPNDDVHCSENDMKRNNWLLIFDKGKALSAEVQIETFASYFGRFNFVKQSSLVDLSHCPYFCEDNRMRIKVHICQAKKYKVRSRSKHHQAHLKNQYITC